MLLITVLQRQQQRTKEHNRTRLIPSSSLDYVLWSDQPHRSNFVVDLWILNCYTREPQSRTGLGTQEAKKGARAVTWDGSMTPHAICFGALCQSNSHLTSAKEHTVVNEIDRIPDNVVALFKRPFWAGWSGRCKASCPSLTQLANLARW